jgi:hypothetical protein
LRAAAVRNARRICSRLRRVATHDTDEPWKFTPSFRCVMQEHAVHMRELLVPDRTWKAYIVVSIRSPFGTVGASSVQCPMTNMNLQIPNRLCLSLDRRIKDRSFAGASNKYVATCPKNSPSLQCPDCPWSTLGVRRNAYYAPTQEACSNSAPPSGGRPKPCTSNVRIGSR